MMANSASYFFRTFTFVVVSSLAITSMPSRLLATEHTGLRTPENSQKSSEPELSQQVTHNNSASDQSKFESATNLLDRTIQLENEHLRRTLIICRHC
jgi:hypothetical protein